MEIAASNIIINYFLLHNDVKCLTFDKLNNLINQISDTFHVKIVDANKKELKMFVQLCSDFLYMDNDCNIYQKNILDYLEEIEPIYEWFSFVNWKHDQEYYNLIRKFV